MPLGVAEAAARLGVGERRIRALVASGALRADRVGRAYVFDEEDVEALAAQTRPVGSRSMSPRIAWGAAALADGATAPWLRDDERSRLRSRMTRYSVPRWRVALGRLAGVHYQLRGAPDAVTQLLADARTLRGGTSATNLVTDPLVGLSSAHVWVADNDTARQLKGELGLLGSTNHNITISVPAASVDPMTADGINTYRLVVAQQLLATRDGRAVAAGRALAQAVTSELGGPIA